MSRKHIQAQRITRLTFQWLTFFICMITLALIIVARFNAVSPLQTVEGKAEVIQPEPTVVISEQFSSAEVYEMTETEMLARVIWGEARGCDKTQQAAVVWCVLNRVDAGFGSISEVVTAPGQFSGWNVHNPVIEIYEQIAIDVLYRHEMEKHCVGNVGRVLPKEYLWFTGNGEVNLYRADYNDYYHMWDWSLPNPYEE